MHEIHEYKAAKVQVLKDLNEHLSDYADRLNSIDPRLMIYIEDAISNNGSHANLMELLGIRKELRLCDSYELNPERVKLWLRAIEGIWENGQHVKGGLKFDTPRGNDHVMLMPYQMWCLFGIYAFDTRVDMERPWVDNERHEPTEYRGENGNVWDKRRLCQEAHLFQTRKSGKTEFGAALDFVEANILGPANAQTLIATNSREQSKIAYKAIKQFAYQVDPSCLNRMGGKMFRVTADEMNWQPGHKRKGEIKVMSAGGKKKDGLGASQVHADEHGSAEYINGNSDMQGLVDVCWGSTGPRREKLLLHTTTAGRIKEGPYKDQLEVVEDILMTELEHPLGVPCRTDEDTWFAFMLQLDKWELTYDLDQLDDTELFKKVNRSIGITVQPNYYKQRLQEARRSEDTKKEALSKDFNIWQGNRLTKWLTGDQIRPRQIDRRIMDCAASEGWKVFCGLDFGGTDDIWASAYLAVNYQQQDPAGRFFADLDLWITEAALQESPNRPLFERWIADGWMHVCPGSVFSHEMAVNMVMFRAGYNELGQLAVDPARQIDIQMFGFDPAQSTQPINHLKAWMQSLGLDPKIIKQMVVPVPQTFVTMNGLVQETEYMLLTEQPWLQLSMNPAWSWMFGNCKLEISPNELKKPLKSGANNKIDGVHALLDAMYLFDYVEGQIQV